MVTSGDLTPSGRSAGTPVFSFRITGGEDIFQDNIALLITPQKFKIQAIFGTCLAPASICGITKTQPQAKWKAAKNAKAELVEDKKLAIEACKVESISKEKRSFSFSLLRPRHLWQDPRLSNSSPNWWRQLLLC
jgi:hypothetical protein